MSCSVATEYLDELCVTVCRPDKPRAAVLLAHGLMLDSTMWEPVVSGLGDDLLIINPDHRGHGASGPGSVPLGVPTLARDLATLAGELVPAGLPLIAVGHSLGSMGLLHAMSENLLPSSLTGTVLVGASAGALGTAVLRRVLTLLPHVAQSQPELFDRGWSLSRRALTPWLGPADPTPVRTKPTPAVVAALLASLQNWDVRARLDELAGLPARVLCGQTDRITPVSHSQYIVDHLGSSAQLYTAAKIGHDLPIRRPERIAEAVTGLLTDL